MAKKLVIVESPSKTKTIQGILGRDYKVVASKGHIRQLAKSRTKNDINLPITRNDKNAHISIPGVQKKGKKFIPRWAAIDDDQKKTISTLKKEVERSDSVFLATDPDREGEAIAWHIVDALNLDISTTKRVVFNQITKHAVEEAFENSKEIDDDLVEAYKARAIQDKVWGFMMSQTLWPTIKRNLSAGRVQSPTLGEIDKKEKEIQSFVPEEFWNIDAKFELNDKSEPLKIPLKKIFSSGKTINVESRELRTEQESMIHTEALKQAKFFVSDVSTKERKSNPPQPLRTSTLQQQAFRRFRFNSSRTMSLAQQLYQGIDLGGGEGQVGLITYMRTDSKVLSNEAVSDISNFVTEKFSKSYLQVRNNSKSVQGAQEAHEAIRPTYITRTPESLRNQLDSDQFKLYQLIWTNTVASQMAAAVYDRTTFEISAEPSDSDPQYLFSFSGDVLKFDGFRKIIIDQDSDDEIPDLQKNQELKCVEILPEQRFTKPPSRYNEASLVNFMESVGIGRPSTYASTIKTLIDKKYIERKKGSLHITALGSVVSEFLHEHYSDLMSYEFTAQMERLLDDIAHGDTELQSVLNSSYDPFVENVVNVYSSANRVDRDRLLEFTGEKCPQCDKRLTRKDDYNFLFLGCEDYPNCTYTQDITTGSMCPDCENNPELWINEDPGKITVNKYRGQLFYGCSNYRKENGVSVGCKFSSGQLPLDYPKHKCPDCGDLLLFSGRGGLNIRCKRKNFRLPKESQCGFSVKKSDFLIDEEDDQ